MFEVVVVEQIEFVGFVYVYQFEVVGDKVQEFVGVVFNVGVVDKEFDWVFD